MSDWQVIQGDSRVTLAELPAGSWHCCVTSPPYFGLRRYKAGDAEVGTESSVESYVASLLAVFGGRDNPVGVWRVLRDDGVLFVNLAGSFSGGGQYRGNSPLSAKQATSGGAQSGSIRCGGMPKLDGYKPGDLIEIPALVAEALRRAGWTYRQRITWVKGLSLCEDYSGTSMPESCAANGTYWVRHRVKVASGPKNATAVQRRGVGLSGSNPTATQAQWADCPGCPTCDPHKGYVLRVGQGRPASSTEAVLMFTKGMEAFIDMEGVREAATYPNDKRRPVGSPGAWELDSSGRKQRENGGGKPYDHDTSKRCLRSAWWLPISDTWLVNPGGNSDVAGEHFALMPPKLAELCIRIGTSERGCCPNMGGNHQTIAGLHRNGGNAEGAPSRTLDWWPTCSCQADPVPSIVGDPFAGLCTTGVAALRLGRSFVGCELNPSYAERGRKRLADATRQGRLL